MHIYCRHKWFQTFELIEEFQSKFELKTILSPETKKADSILELEKSSILIDNSGEFIEFLELEQIFIKSTLELKSELFFKKIGIGIDFRKVNF